MSSAFAWRRRNPFGVFGGGFNTSECDDTEERDDVVPSMWGWPWWGAGGRGATRGGSDDMRDFRCATVT
jgi:hypothetical protein